MAKKSNTVRLTPDLKIQIRNEYVQGVDNGEKRIFSNIDELITKHGVAKTTLYRISKKEKWKEQRQKFKSTLVEKIENVQKNLTDISKQINNTSLNAAKAIFAIVGKNINNNAEAMNAGGSGFNPNQINALADAALKAQKLAKIALGESTENININADRVEERIMQDAWELLDKIAEERKQVSSGAVH